MTRLCSIEGCSRPSRARLMCNQHYLRFRKYGDPLGGGTRRGEPEEFYQTVVLPHDGVECLIWPFARNELGYGRMFAKDGKTTLVHRRACEDRNGPPPTPEHEAAHSCGKGHEGCVSPAHARWATATENSADMVLHGTANQKAHGESHPGAKLTEEDVRAIRASKGETTRAQVAARYGVKPETIKAIYSRKTWAWLQ